MTLAQNAFQTYNGGLQWPELFIAQQGMTTSITYTATCGEVPVDRLPSTRSTRPNALATTASSRASTAPRGR